MLSHIDWAGDFAASVAAHRGLACAVDEKTALTYGEFGALATALARRLQAEGLMPGEPVATCLPNGVVAAWASAALRLAGAAETPLNPAFTAAERRYCLELAGVRRVVAERGDAGFFAGEGAIVMAIEEITPEASPGTFPSVPAAAWGRISFTSGTTGKPKAIVHTHGARWIANLLQRASFWEMPRPGSAILLMTPMTHGAGLIAQAFLDHGARLELRRGVDPAEVERLLEARAIDHLFAPPTVLAKLVAALPQRRFPGLRTVYCGTAPLSPALYEKARALFGPVIRVTYGKTEIVNPIATLPPTAADRYYREPTRGAGSCVGWPGSGVAIEVCRDDGTRCEVEEIGEVHLRAQHMLAGHIDAAGFHPMPEGGWHATGDLGRVDGEGRLHLVGRTADVVKSGGYKIQPEEIETALAGCAGNAAIAVTSLPSEYWGEILVAVAESPPPDWQSRAIAAAETIAKFKRPRAYLALAELPRNAQGKVPRARLREMLLQRWRIVDGPHPQLVPQP